jgi:hypothetical protein
MKSETIKVIVLDLCLLAVAAFCVVSCAEKKPETNSKVIAKASVDGWNGSEFYAEVKEGSLPEMYAVYRATMSDLGMPKATWDKKFDCNHLADIYVAANQVKFAVENWHTDTKAEALALGVVWFKQDAGTYHAIVEARINGRTAYIDPAVGSGEINLSQSEVNSIYFRKY